jgi:gamma-glutamylputrescine oxidase
MSPSDLPPAAFGDFPTRHVPRRASAAQTWYHTDAPRSACTDLPPPRPWQGQGRADVVVVGAGLTGVSAALDLAAAGLDVAVLEAGVLGAGASGRNGGLVCSGWRHDQGWLEQRMGREDALALWQLAEDAKAHLHGRIARLKLDAGYEPGLVFAAHTPTLMDALDADSAHLVERYGYGALARLDRADCARALGTDVYLGGWRDDGAGRIQPLRLLHGLAAAAVASGARLFEGSRALSLARQGDGTLAVAVSGGGEVRARHVLLCGDGYLDGVDSALEARVLPISSFVLATGPLDPGLGVMAAAAGAMDTRFVVNYFHRTHDGRLLFGGGEKYTPGWPQDIGGFVRDNLVRIFPSLRNTPITHAWGGALGITPTRLPCVRQLSAGVLCAAGYSGQGVLLAPYFGSILARAVVAQDGRFDLLSRLPVPPFPGGRLLRWPLLTAAMSYYALRDRLG